MERKCQKKLQRLSSGLFSGLVLLLVVTGLLWLAANAANASSEAGQTRGQVERSQLATTTPPPAGPTIFFLEGPFVKVGDRVKIVLSNHTTGSYDLYFAEQYIGSVVVDASGTALYSPYVIAPLAPGFYTLKSALPGQTTPYAASTIEISFVEAQRLSSYCAPLIQNGKFEDTELMSLWHYSAIAEQVTRTSVPHWIAPGENFSMLLPDTTVSGLPRHPWLYQEITLPSWVLTPTLESGSSLTLTLHVGVNPEGSPEPDPLFVSLLDQAGSLTVVGPITLATGAETPTLDPLQPDNNDWLFKSINLADYFSPADYKNQTLRLYFAAPNPTGTDSTRFYLDNVDLILCTIEETTGDRAVIEAPYSTTALAGQIVIYTHTITNTSPGLLPKVFVISATGSLWEPTWQPLTVTLIPGEAAPVTVTLPIPNDAPDYALNVMSITVASQTDPGTVLDMVIDTTAVDPLPETVNNPITPAGVTTQVLTITTGLSVVWVNQTTATQELFSCHLLYFPLIFKNSAATESLPGQAQNRQSTSDTIWPIVVGLEPGQSYTQTFTMPGVFHYCVANFPEVTNTVVVLGGPAPDFRAAISPVTQSITAGEEVIYSLHLNALYGFTNPVTLSVTGAPSQTTAYFSQNPTPPTAKPRLIVSSTLAAPSGTHRLLIQGTGGDVSHTLAASLTILAPPPELDLVVILDRSGSMEFDPVCYGCWERTETAADHQGDSPRWSGYYTYPGNGVLYPVGFNDGDPLDGGFGHPKVAEVCNPTPNAIDTIYRLDPSSNTYYMILEAELYSLNPSPVSTEFRESGKGYWALQRGEGNYDDPVNPYWPSEGFSIDARGAHMAHHPSSTFYPPPDQPLGKHYTLAEAQAGEAPVLVYDFKFRNGGGGPNPLDWTGDPVYIWVRVHGGRGVEVDGIDFPFPFHGDAGSGTNAYWGWTADLNGDGVFGDAFRGVDNIPAFPLTPGTGWQWVRLNPADPITPNTNSSAIYQLQFYAGSSGFSLDQIVITNDANPALPVEVQNQSGGSLATQGSAFRSACDPCNVIYGENIGAVGSGMPYELDDCSFFVYNQPVNHALDALFGEWESPLRPAKEAVKRFVNLLDPEQDQVGLVSYSQANGVVPTVTKTELECLRRYGVESCARGGNPFSYTQVLKDVEDVRASATTNTGAGMKAGLEVLGVDVYGEGALGTTCGGATCARGAEVQRIMILLTDGVPNENPGGACQTAGPSWMGSITDPDSSQEDYDCPLYFAQVAAQTGITVYVIGFGYGTQPDYLQEIANLGHGQFFFAVNQADLDLIFDLIGQLTSETSRGLNFPEAQQSLPNRPNWSKP